MKTERIRNEAALVQAIKEYLAQGRSVSEITIAVNQRGVACYAVGIELLIQKYRLN